MDRFGAPTARSLSREKALSPEPLLAYAMNGEPLTLHQGFPLRLLVPGWYGVANVKWLSEIHVQEDAYLGKYQARWYRTFRGEMINGEMKWTERAVTHMQLKSFIARVSRDGNTHKVFGVVLNDGTPIKTVEVRIDEGLWQPATMDPHTLVSGVTDVTGRVQPTAEELETKKTFLEDDSQYPRKVLVS